MTTQPVNQTAAAAVIASFAALHRPDAKLSRSPDPADYSSNGNAIVANLRDIARLINQAVRVLH